MKKNKETESNNEKTNELGSGFWISFTDLMSCLLLVLMLVIISMKLYHISPEEFNELKTNYDSKVEELEIALKKLNYELRLNKVVQKRFSELTQKFNEIKENNKELNLKLKQYSNTDVILNDIVSKIRDKLVECGNQYFYGIDFAHLIILNKDSNTIRISEKVLNFKLGESIIKSESSKMYIKKCIARVLNTELNSINAYNVIDSVFIEGHTDDNPYQEDTKKIKNWTLSAERAIEFWYHLRNSSFTLDSIRNKKGEPLFSVSGYAYTRPVSVCITDNVSNRKLQKCINNNLTKDQSDERNRRIDIKFKALYLPVTLE